MLTIKLLIPQPEGCLRQALAAITAEVEDQVGSPAKVAEVGWESEADRLLFVVVQVRLGAALCEHDRCAPSSVRNTIICLDCGDELDQEDLTV